MENSLEGESEYSSLGDVSHIPSIHLEEFLMEEHARGLSTLEAPKIFTVARTLKDPFIISHIKPDYGSLGEFMVDASLRKDFLSQKKRKNEGVQEENGEKRMRQLLKDKSPEELSEIYLSANSSAWQKKMASKLMVEGIFKDTFHSPIQTFEAQNTKQEAPRNTKINLNEIDEIFRDKSDLQIKGSVNKSKQLSGDQEDSKKVQVKDENSSTRSFSPIDKTTLLQQLKARFASFRWLNLEEADRLFLQSRAIKKDADQDQPQKLRVQGIQLKAGMLVIDHREITPTWLMGALNWVDLKNVTGLSVQQVRITDECLFFLLDFLLLAKVHIKNISICKISINNLEQLIDKMKKILLCTPLKTLLLENLGIDSKQFCSLCLAVAENQTLEKLSLNSNDIDQAACRTLGLIAKHCSSLRRIEIAKNCLDRHVLGYLPEQSKQKIIL